MRLGGALRGSKNRKKKSGFLDELTDQFVKKTQRLTFHLYQFFSVSVILFAFQNCAVWLELANWSEFCGILLCSLSILIFSSLRRKNSTSWVPGWGAWQVATYGENIGFLTKQPSFFNRKSFSLYTNEFF